MNKIKQFLDRYLPFPADLLPEDSYLVGGVVRDILLHRTRDYLDLDFVTPHSAIATTKKISNTYKVGFVVLDQERNIARAVFPARQQEMNSEIVDFPATTIDIAQQEGESVRTDLSRRDFTINAIAYDYANNKTIDPYDGQKDLEAGVMRMIAPKNLRDDPLRLLRAYRQACQLNFTIEEETRNTIKQIAPSLTEVAEERIHTELGYVLKHANGTNWLVQAYEDGLLTPCFPSLQESQIALLSKIDRAVELIQSRDNLANTIDESLLAGARLTCLVHEGAESAEKQLTQLKYSRQEIKAVITTLRYLPSLQQQGFKDSLRQQYFFFQGVGVTFPTVALFALANGIDEELILQLCDRYSDTQDTIAHPQPLLTGNDIINNLNISPSPIIGEMLTEVQIAYIEGKVKSQQQGLDWLKSQEHEFAVR